MLITRTPEHTITPCDQCYFFKNNDCELGRREKYSKMGLVDGTNILTFCNYARDPILIKEGYDPKQVDYDNRIKYDLVVRIDKSLDIHQLDRFLSLKNPPKKIILSYIEVDKKALFDKVANTKLELLKIFNPDRRLELEYQAGTSTWFQVIDLDSFDEHMVEKLEYKINQEIDRILCVRNHLYNRSLCEWMISNDFSVCENNISNLNTDFGGNFVRDSI